MRSLYAYNFRESLADHFNHWRSYAVGDEPGMLVTTYPHGERPTRPFPYVNEVWTGMEYTAAVQMILSGEHRLAERVVAAARSRFDGRKRNQFNEPECGHHYVRAMSSWVLVVASSGVRYDAVDRRLDIAVRPEGPFESFWSSGDAWGHLRLSTSSNGTRLTFQVVEGTLPVDTVALGEELRRVDAVLADGNRLDLEF